ncbi:MAG: formate hydrogenase [Leptospira sp.]|nr:formate hydrogenase [Leptospira sp.]
MIYDFIYLLLLLTGIFILVENRLSRIIFFVGFQGFLLIFPVIQVHESKISHSISLIILILLFKVLLTPLILKWASQKSKMKENTTPRFGYLATLLFLTLGVVVAVQLTDRVPPGINKISLIYVILMIYVGILCFVFRKNWLALIAGFSVFENGIFVLTLVLDQGLPFGLEFGSFLDAILVIVAGGILQLSPHLNFEEREV